MRKGIKRGLAYLLVLLLVLQLAGTFTVNAQTLPLYNAFSDYKTLTQTGAWSYQEASGGVYTNLAWDSGISMWHTNAYVSTSQDVYMTGQNTMWFHPGVNIDSVVTFTAPSSGTIKIKSATGIGVAVADNSGDGIVFTIKNGNTNLFAPTVITKNNRIANGNNIDFNITTTVNAGDKIHFIVGMNGNNSGDATYVTPVIEYEIDVVGVENNATYDLKNGIVPIGFNIGTATLNGASIESGYYVNSCGNYSLIVTSGSKTKQVSFTVTYIGDVNNNGVIEIGDLVAIKSHLLKITTLEGVSFLNAKMTGRTTIGISDFITLKKILLNNNPIILPIYNAYNDYSATAQGTVWSYQSRITTSDGFLYDNLFSNGTNWGDSETGVVSTSSSDLVLGITPVMNVHPVVNKDVAICFTAPYTGTIDVNLSNGGIFAPYNSTDGVNFYLLKNNIEITSYLNINNTNSHPASNRRFTDTKTITVHKGDNIRFVVNMNTSTNSDNTFFNPVITYKTIVSLPTTYYISSSLGNDSNSGTSVNNPWRTFSNLRGLALYSGEKVLLKSGDIWCEQLNIDNISGTKDNPVVISSYGTGYKPKITRFVGSVPNYSDTPCVLATNASGMEIKGLNIGLSGVGIDLYYNNTFNNEYVLIEDCDFHDIYGFNQIDYNNGIVNKYPHATSIVLTRKNLIVGNTDPSLIGLYINRCTTFDAGSLYTYGSNANNTDEGGGVSLNGLYVTNSVMENNGIYGIVIANILGGYMDNCIIKNNGSRPMPAGSMGVMISAEDFAITNCEIYGQQRQGLNPDGGGIDFEHLCKNILVENNYIHDNAGVGIMFYDSNGGVTHANVECDIKNNVFENNNRNSYQPSIIAEITAWAGTSCPHLDSTVSGNSYLYNEFTQFYHQRISSSTVTVTDNTPYYSLSSNPYPLLDKNTVSQKVRVMYDGYNKSKYITANLVGNTQLGNYTLSGEKYIFSTGFGATTNPWYYLYNNGVYNNMSFADGSWNASAYYATYSIITKDGMHPDMRGTTALGFKAPQSGTVLIDMEKLLSVSNGSADGTVITVLNAQGKLICDQIFLTAAVNKKNFKPVRYNVQQNELIYFCLSKNESNSDDFTSVSPVIEYINGL